MHLNKNKIIASHACSYNENVKVDKDRSSISLLVVFIDDVACNAGCVTIMDKENNSSKTKTGPIVQYKV